MTNGRYVRGTLVLALAVILLSVKSSDDPLGSAGRFAHATPLGIGTTTDAVESVLATSVALDGDGIYGAGVLLLPARGLVLTSLHVVDDMGQVRITAFGGRTSKAKVIATNKDLDLALLSAPDLVDATLAAPKLADPTTLRPAEEVFAIGSPRKLPFTVSRGIVSYIGREMEGSRYLQVDMSINDGNSGGPVLTRRGEVVAIMSFILRRSQGLAFAIPVTEAVRAFADWLPELQVKSASASPTGRCPAEKP